LVLDEFGSVGRFVNVLGQVAPDRVAAISSFNFPLDQVKVWRKVFQVPHFVRSEAALGTVAVVGGIYSNERIFG
jgi:hypothetical protein